MPPDYDDQVKAVAAAMARKALSTLNGGAIPSLAAAAVLALRDYRRRAVALHAASAPWGHSQVAHALLGWCAHCDGADAVDEAVAWRVFAVTGDAPPPPAPDGATTGAARRGA